MAKVLCVTSGKGGVGKTTTTAALGAALAQAGEKVCVVDFDVGLRNLDLIMGAERRVVYDLINVTNGDAKLPQALIRDKRLENLSLLPASQTRDKDALTDEGVERVMGELREKFDWIVCDSPAGIERGAQLAMRHADVAVVVTNPEVSSVRDSDRIIGLLDSKTVRAEKGDSIEKHLILTRFDPARADRGDMLKVDDVLEILSIPLLAIIGEPGSPARVEPRLPGDAQQPALRPGPRLCRRGAPPEGRDRADVDPDRSQVPDQQAVHPEGRMSVLTFLKPRGSGSVARERLQLILAHERSETSRPDLVITLREEILAVIAKHIEVERDKVQITLERGEGVSTLGVDIEFPVETPKAAKKRATA